MANEYWTPEQLAQFRHDMGFDRPWPVQYADYMGNVLQGDFGISLRQRQPAFDLVMERMPATLQLTAAALVLSVVISVPVGVISAVKRNSWFDILSMGGALLGQSIPGFWLGIMAILLFAVVYPIFPPSGYGGLSHLVMPAVTLAAYSVARNARLVRSSVLEILGQDYVRTAKAKGLSHFRVTVKHALRNALIPVVTVIGLQIGELLGGAVVTETIFSWPGVGRLVVNAVGGKDFPVVQGVVTMMALIFVLINLVVDLAYGLLDPRIRYD